MQNKIIGIGLAVLGALVVATPAFAAANLSNGGIGQQAGNMANFGLSVCNNGDTTAASVPMTVAANNVVIHASSPDAIASQSCSYLYLPYASFNMTSGNSYFVHSAISGGDTAKYTLTVPSAGVVLGASTQNITAMMLAEIQLLQQLISLYTQLLGTH